ncbi:MAG: hypothetical protein ABJM98_04775, partial [Ekhidna sp.]
MRLGQLARKYDIRVQDIISYLENDATEEIHSNTKLNDQDEADVLDFFGIEAVKELVIQEELEVIQEEPEDVREEPITETKEAKSPTEEESEWDAEDSEYVVQKEKTLTIPETPLDDIASVEGEIEPVYIQEKPAKEESGVIIEELKSEDLTPKEDEVIQTDKLLEMLESEEIPAELAKIKLIKAPKKELSGLKVLGKVDLPEPKKKSELEEEQEKKSNRERKYQRPQLSEEEKEKRRLKAKRKQEAYEAREEKRRTEQEAQKLKELRS